MDLKLLGAVFATVFVAGLGDKAQLATLLYAADAGRSCGIRRLGGGARSPSAIGVAAGTFVSQHVNPQILSWVAGAGFIAIGLWTILRA
jgi:putative Ca2+/H+ antiporter (TMEM165/GDT1 family)